MQYVLFTYPNCLKCEELKLFLQDSALEGEELSLVKREGKMRIRDFIKDLNREKGAIIVPTLVMLEEGNAVSVLNSRKELEDWLKSRG